MTPGKITSLRLAIAVLIGFAAAEARADEAADTAAARILGGDGVLLADAGDCPQAIEKLSRAEILHHAPTTAARLGECEIAVGHLVAGTERLQRVLREPLAAGAAQASVAAVARARVVLEQALPRIPTIRVSVAAPVGARFVVTLDGEPLPEAILGSDRPADPQAHKLQVSGDGFLTVTKDLTLTDGEAKRVSLELEPDPRAKATAKALSGSHGHVSKSVARGSGFGPAAVVALTIGAMGLGAGVGGGLVVAHQSSDLSKNCSASNVCPLDKQAEISSAKTWATVSTIGFAAAGAGLATAVVLLLTGNKELHESSATVQISPMYVGLVGGF